jgi:hypothetical protein
MGEIQSKRLAAARVHALAVDQGAAVNGQCFGAFVPRCCCHARFPSILYKSDIKY